MTSPDDLATDKLWPTTRGAVRLIDGLHSATGLPWWATLSLTALGVRAALLPFTLKQMHASTALMSEWRLATRRAAMRHAQTGGASTTSSTRTQSAAPASMGNGALRSAASTTASATSSVSQTTATAEPDPSRTGEFGEAAPAHSELASCTGDGSALRPAESEMKQIHGRLGASDENDRAQPDSSSSRSSNNMDTRPPRHSRPDVRSILDEYRRVRGESRAPSAAWLLGSPLLQLSVFGTSVFAARHMAAHNWPGFASGGLLWFPDLTKAAAVIHWGQGIETTAVAFPCGQLGVVLPVAISLALFANINLGFAQPQGAPKPSGEGAVVAYIMGALRTAMEWATVPVLAVAMCLPHGALVYWLSSSTVSLAQTAILRQPAVKRALQLPVQSFEAGTEGRAWAAAGTAAESAAASSEVGSIDQLFLQAAESKAAGDPARAVEIITAIRAQHPQHARAHFAAGQLHADLQQWQLAEEAYVTGASLEADLAQRARCLLGAGVAQHKQGDLEAALQAFARASADALSAAGLSESALSGAAAAPYSSAASALQDSASNDALFGSRLTEANLSSQHEASSSSRAAVQETLHSAGTGSMTKLASDSSFGAACEPVSGGGPSQDPAEGTHARHNSSSGAESGAQSRAQTAMSSDSGDVQASAMAERTAVRALMAQASVLKRFGRLPDALQALHLATVLDRGVEVHARKLQAEMRGPSHDETLGRRTES